MMAPRKTLIGTEEQIHSNLIMFCYFTSIHKIHQDLPQQYWSNYFEYYEFIIDAQTKPTMYAEMTQIIKTATVSIPNKHQFDE